MKDWTFGTANSWNKENLNKRDSNRKYLVVIESALSRNSAIEWIKKQLKWKYENKWFRIVVKACRWDGIIEDDNEWENGEMWIKYNRISKLSTNFQVI